MIPRDIRPGIARLFRLALRRQRNVADEAGEEVAFHLEQREQQLMERGVSPAAARAKARQTFGDVDAARNSLVKASRRRENRSALRETAANLAHDVRFAVRSLRRSPSFLIIALACLTLGIGANVTIFALVDAVLFQPLPYQRPAELVRVWSDAVVPAGIFEIVKRASTSYSALDGAEGARAASLTNAGAPVRVMVSQITAGLFNTLGVTPAVGRGFDGNANESSAPLTAVISDGFWQAHFGGDRLAVGKTVQLDGISRVIIGVMPPKFAYPSDNVQFWIPATFVRNDPSYWWSTYFALVGRLKPGVTTDQARAEAAIVFPRARSSFPMRMPDGWAQNVDVVRLQQSVVKSTRSAMVLLYGAVGLVLLVACVNVAGLYIGRAMIRSREIAVRSALGAGRARIVRLLAVESLMVSALGAMFGLTFAWFALRALVVALPPDTPRLAEVAIGGRVLAMTLLLAVGTSVVFGLLPVLRVSRGNFATALRSDSRSGASRLATRASGVLAVAQVALAVTLVTSAGLLMKSLWQLQNVSLGFSTTNVMTSAIPLPAFPNDTAVRTPRFYDAVLEQVRGIPGITSVAVTSSLPFGDGIQSAAMETEAHPTTPGDIVPTPQLSAVSTDYFSTLHIPLLEGRLLNDADREGTLRVGVIDQAGARALYPDDRVIGQRIRYVWNQDWITIVGVVGNVKRDSLSSTPQPSLYLPSRQAFPRALRVVVRSSLPVESVAASLRAAVARVDATVPVGDAVLLSRIVSGSAARQRFIALLLVAFGGMALLLGAVGIYGVINTSVVQRTREIGVRMALGATKRNVLRAVLEQSLTISASGVVLGLGGSLASAGLLRGLLYGVSVFDLTVLLGVVVLLAVVAVAAALAPALRASRVDPLTAIRAE